MFSIKKGFENQIYVGIDFLTPENGVMKIRLGEMTNAQLEAWLRLNPKTARQFVNGPSPKPTKKDNTPAKPLPTKPEAAKK